MEECSYLFDKFQMTAVLEGLTCRTALLVDLGQLLNFLEDVKDNWERWSVAFSSICTGMEGLSAVLSGSAVLMDDTGVMREQAETRGVKDLSSYQTSEMFRGSQHLQKEGASYEQRRNLLRWSPMKC